jgi:hypothetical protein
MKPRRLETLYAMLGTPNSGLALAPVAQAGTAAAHNVTCVQTKDLSAPTASPADEMQEDAARTHAKAGDANFGGDRHAVVSLQRQSYTWHVERQST